MNILIEQTGAYEIEARLSHAPAAYLAVVQDQMDRTIALLYGRVREKLDGGVLQRRSSELYDSIQKDIRTQGDEIVTGRVFTNSPYASIQERGGTTRPHEIVVKNAQALRFVTGKIWFTRDDIVFARRVQHPGSRIPARSYMASTLTECFAIIREIFKPRVV